MKTFLTRKCDSPTPTSWGTDCSSLGPSFESQACNTQSCQSNIDGGYSPVSAWSPCSVSTCPTNRLGGTFYGYQTRFRTCTNPAPGGDGRNCSSLGTSDERLECSIDCPWPIALCPGSGKCSRLCLFQSLDIYSFPGS